MSPVAGQQLLSRVLLRDIRVRPELGECRDTLRRECVQALDLRGHAAAHERAHVRRRRCVLVHLLATFVAPRAGRAGHTKLRRAPRRDPPRRGLRRSTRKQLYTNFGAEWSRAEQLHAARQVGLSTRHEPQ